MAKQFEFRLETVLKLRKQDEDAAKRVVAERLREIRGVEAEITGLRGQIAQQLDAFRETNAAGQLDMTQISRHRFWLTHLDRGVLLGQHRLAELHGELAKERAALAEARKRVRILEKLKERQYERYRKELDRAEAIENDEIGKAIYLRQQQGVESE